jgi:hypothetical protein
VRLSWDGTRAWTVDARAQVVAQWKLLEPSEVGEEGQVTPRPALPPRARGKRPASGQVCQALWTLTRRYLGQVTRARRAAQTSFSLLDRERFWKLSQEGAPVPRLLRRLCMPRMLCMLLMLLDPTWCCNRPCVVRL